MPDFTPGPDQSDARALRAALGKFATGVTIVTAPSERGPLGMTANSFASVSLDPPLILWCPAKASRRHETFVNAPHFAVHVIGVGQAEVCQGFSNRGDAFDVGDWRQNEHGVPLLDGCPARFECSIRDRIDAGDHTVIIGKVERVSVSDAIPLVFHQGLFGGFNPEKTD